MPWCYNSPLPLFPPIVHVVSAHCYFHTFSLQPAVSDGVRSRLGIGSVVHSMSCLKHVPAHQIAFLNKRGSEQILPISPCSILNGKWVTFH